MKTTNIPLLVTIRFMSALLGYGAAVSFMRAFNRTFNFNIGMLIGESLNFGQGPSILMLAFCLGSFALSIWLAKGRPVYPLRRVDYMFLMIFCGSGFAISASITWQQLGWWSTWSHNFSLFMPLTRGTTWTNVIVIPFIAYFLALVAFGELVARTRDRTLLQTLYWVRFFKVYSVWRPIGFFALLVITGQSLLLVTHFTLLAVLVFSLFTIGAFTYCAAHMLSLAAEYDIASAEKIQAERFKSELITNVSHDIKTPLTSIINYVDLLTTTGLQGQAAEYLDVLVRKSARLKVLIDDLMEASKAGTGSLRANLERLNLAEIVGQVAGEFEDSFSENGLTLVIRQPELPPVEFEDAQGQGTYTVDTPKAAPVFIFADSRHLYRALENLFSNAAKYAQRGTRVFAEITPLLREGKVQFTLQNTSAAPIEMSEGELTEQFIRGDRARQTEGSGLGLYIAKSLIELMGGSLYIRVVGDLFRVEVEM